MVTNRMDFMSLYSLSVAGPLPFQRAWACNAMLLFSGCGGPVSVFWKHAQRPPSTFTRYIGGSSANRCACLRDMLVGVGTVTNGVAASCLDH